jgi:hypothetical protein
MKRPLFAESVSGFDEKHSVLGRARIDFFFAFLGLCCLGLVESHEPVGSLE